MRVKARRENIFYEQQLEKEYTGLIQASRTALWNMKNKIMNKEEITFEDYAQYSIFTDLVSMWDGLSDDPDRLMDFLISSTYKEIPYVDIGSRLLAKIITSASPIESGDSMDVEHVSTVIPYCDFVVTDRKMKNRIIHLGIDKQYNTKVFCLKETDDLIKELEKL